MNEINYEDMRTILRRINDYSDTTEVNEIVDKIKMSLGEVNENVRNDWRVAGYSADYKFHVTSDFYEEHMTLMGLAAKWGFRNIVNHFLTLGADVNISYLHGNTALILAIKKSHVNVAKDLISANANVQVRNRYKETALYFASGLGDVDLVRQLIQRNAEVNEETIDSYLLPLYAAVENGHFDVIQYLLANGAQYTGVPDFCPINVAAYHGHLHLVKYFIECLKMDCTSVDGDLGWTVLHDAASQGHCAVVRYVLGMEPSLVNVTSNNGGTALLYAAGKGRLDTVQVLIEHGADCEIRDENGEHVLETAVHCDNIDVVKYLIETVKLDANLVIKEGRSLGHVAAASTSGNLDLFRYLIEEICVNIDAVDNKGSTALHLAAEHGYLDKVKYLVTDREAKVMVADKNALYPLQLAAKGGYLDVVKFFVSLNPNKANYYMVNAFLRAIEKGRMNIVKYFVEELNTSVDGDDVRDIDGLTPIHVAASGGHFEILKYLLDEKNGNPETDDYNNWRPLHCAVVKGETSVVVYLLDEKGVDISATTSIGLSVAHLAALNNCLSTLKCLVARGADINAVDEELWTPVLCAANSGHFEVLKYLIDEKHGDYKLKDMCEMGVLHHAAMNGFLDITKYFVDKNVGINDLDTDNRSPLYLAVMQQHLNVVDYLVSQSADLETADKYGRTILHIAVKSNNLDTVRILARKTINVFARDCDCKTPLDVANELNYEQIASFLQEYVRSLR